MSVKKSDYFGKFLDTLSDRGPASESAVPRVPSTPGVPRTPAVPRTPSSPGSSLSAAQLLDRCIALLKAGPRSLKDLLLPGDSFSAVFGAVQQLQDIGYVERAEGDMFRLTDRGREAVQAIERPG